MAAIDTAHFCFPYGLATMCFLPAPIQTWQQGKTVLNFSNSDGKVLPWGSPQCAHRSCLPKGAW